MLPALRLTDSYRAAIRNIVENQPNLDIFQAACNDLIMQGDGVGSTVCGVVTNTNMKIYGTCVVLTTGTFLGGVIHIGLDNHSGGRAGDPPSIALAQRLREMPFNVGRLKTGTPARIDARSVDFSAMQAQPGDTPLPVMSYMGHVSEHPEQVNCYITHTNERTHEIIRANLDRSPMYAGVIEGIGPRYCPSIEDKIMRFADKTSHQIFVEPEGLNSNELYPNGISTSLPFDVQLDLIHSIKGFENAHITRPGYAIEYDYFNPQDLRHSLETKFVNNLYFAGQINGTTGYEEAGAQGLLAGLNAALRVQEKDAWTPRRDQSYIGVLVDDLITMGTKEPYRMFTSRAEYRLVLREDNADMRLTEIGRQLGVVDDKRWAAFSAKKEAIEKETERLKTTWVQAGSPESKKLVEFGATDIAREYNLYDLLKRPELHYEQVASLKGEPIDNEQAAEQVEIQAKYYGYISRQLDEIEQSRRYENTKLPADLDYESLGGLSNEAKQKLREIQPETLGVASRISGVTPAAISQILIHLKKRHQIDKS